MPLRCYNISTSYRALLPSVRLKWLLHRKTRQWQRKSAWAATGSTMRRNQGLRMAHHAEAVQCGLLSMSSFLLEVWHFGMNKAEGVYLPPSNKYPGTQHFSCAEELACAVWFHRDAWNLPPGFPWILPHESFPLWILLCIISLELNLSPEYNYMLSPVCPPTKCGNGTGSSNINFSVFSLDRCLK